MGKYPVDLTPEQVGMFNLRRFSMSKTIQRIEGTDDSQFSWFAKLTCPEDTLEVAAMLWALILDRAKDDLKSPDVATRMDAYYWMTSTSSDLYTNLAPRFNVEISPSMFRENVVRAGLPDFPNNGVPFLSMDTDLQDEWCQFRGGENDFDYVSRLADVLTETDIGDHIIAAAINGCKFVYSGIRCDLLQGVIKTFIRSKAQGQYRKGIRQSILYNANCQPTDTIDSTSSFGSRNKAQLSA